MEDNKKLADLIFPNAKKTTYYEEKYHERDLKEGAFVGRFAPSPTGFVHIGGIYTSMVTEKLIRQTDGVFILRIEDTDQEREVESGVEGIIDAMKSFDMNPDEGVIAREKDKGDYGPYTQSQRKDIYQAYAKSLIEKGLAYPCFFTVEELDEIREDQQLSKIRPGIYGPWAKYREYPVKEAIKRIETGDKNFVVRLKSPGNNERKIIHKDLVKGKVEFPENDLDIVIIKSDGLPTYHFAHAIDDHLMRVNLISRSDEWLSSVPIHLQLFDVLGFERPQYAHFAPLLKLDDGNRRKLSKRKDPESAASYYKEEGIPILAVKEYLYNIANPGFEIWRKQNKKVELSEFEIQISKMGKSGALFDMVKLLDVSKDVISRMNKEEVYEGIINWTKQYDKDLYDLYTKNKEFTLDILNIERESGKRKDLAKYSDAKKETIYFFDKIFKENITKFEDYEFQQITDREELKNIIEIYLNKYFNIEDDKQTWFSKVKDLSEELGYAREVKEYRKDPEKYKGHVGDVSTAIRVIVTSKSRTPDLYAILNVLGKESLILRKDLFLNIIK